ncbi:MAG: putative toxin-antitoxin system toxin component, PIN family [Spirochaetia bacterium]
MKVVADTNVIVSGLLNPEGKPAQILNLILNKKIILPYDNRILGEYSAVLYREKFHFPHFLIEPLIDFINMDGQYITAEPINIELPDESDAKFLEVALTGEASYLVTGNTAHFPEMKLVKTPAEILEILFK